MMHRTRNSAATMLYAHADTAINSIPATIMLAMLGDLVKLTLAP
jgi:hypothetical protein